MSSFKLLSVVRLASVLAMGATLAGSAMAQPGGQRQQTTPPYPPTRDSATSPNAERAFRRELPPPQAPSIDTNPNAGRGQSMYPPRVTPGQ